MMGISLYKVTGLVIQGDEITRQWAWPSFGGYTNTSDQAEHKLRKNIQVKKD